MSQNHYTTGKMSFYYNLRVLVKRTLRQGLEDYASICY